MYATVTHESVTALVGPCHDFSDGLRGFGEAVQESHKLNLQ